MRLRFGDLFRRLRSVGRTPSRAVVRPRSGWLGQPRSGGKRRADGRSSGLGVPAANGQRGSAGQPAGARRSAGAAPSQGAGQKPPGWPGGSRQPVPWAPGQPTARVPSELAPWRPGGAGQPGQANGANQPAARGAGQQGPARPGEQVSRGGPTGQAGRELQEQASRGRGERARQMARAWTASARARVAPAGPRGTLCRAAGGLPGQRRGPRHRRQWSPGMPGCSRVLLQPSRGRPGTRSRRGTGWNLAAGTAAASSRSSTGNGPRTRRPRQSWCAPSTGSPSCRR